MDDSQNFPGMVTDPRHNTQFFSTVDWGRFERPLPEWFADSVFGIFIHWGPYSVPAWAEPIGAVGSFPVDYLLKHCPYSEWYANTVRIPGSAAADHHRQVWRNRPYDDFLDLWTAKEFDAEDWLHLFRSAGADYVIPTTKHHDGVTLWDAPGTNGRNTLCRGPRRDLVAEIAQATKKAGLVFGAYYSGGLDWHLRPAPAIDHVRTTTEEARPQDFAYGALAVRHCMDLIDRYKPSVLWNDIGWPDESKFDDSEGSLAALFDYFYDRVADGVINDRWGVPHSDFVTSEYSQGLDRQASGKAWEHCRGIGWSFAHNQNETAADMLTSRDIAREIVDKVFRGGRLLLNVGPDSTGRIPDIQRYPLERLALWMNSAKQHLRRSRQSSPEAVMLYGEGWLRTALTAEGSLLIAVDGNHPARTKPAADEVVEFGLGSEVEVLEVVAGQGEVQQVGQGWRVLVERESPGPLLLRGR